MIVFVGGIIGAGKSTIARKIADAFGCHYYDADETKRQFFQQDPDYEHNMHHGIPFSDETRMKVFRQVIKDLEDLRPHHNRIVVDETLHRRELRHKLFEAAERVYGSYLIVWVRADEDVIIRRLTKNKREGHILDDPIAMFRSFRRHFQEFNRPVVVCNNNGEADEAIAHLRQLLITAGQLSETA